jgi:hypothetical protein
MEIITQEESARLAELEAVIQRGREAFIEVGTALREIRESKLYRVTHGTFEDYFRDRLGLEKSYVKYLMDAADVMSNLKTSTMVEVPTNERQTRPLAKLPAEQQPAAWEKAQEKAKEEGKPVTARHVEEAVAEVMPPKEKPAPEEEPEPLVVDCVKPSNVKIIESSGMAIYSSAKSVMERIADNDTQRESALRAMITYCETKLSAKRKQ